MSPKSAVEIGRGSLTASVLEALHWQSGQLGMYGYDEHGSSMIRYRLSGFGRADSHSAAPLEIRYGRVDARQNSCLGDFLDAFLHSSDVRSDTRHGRRCEHGNETTCMQSTVWP
jgi:hypothetical protein